jgi:cytidylate kinase
MNTTNPLPKLITFDGEARSGKGTIVGACKDYLRDELKYKVMLIDAGQVFRSLVVATSRAGVNCNDPGAIDSFMSDEVSLQQCAQFIKDVYDMAKDERDALLYTNAVSENSAKIAARPLSQKFKDDLLRKWYADAREEGYQIILHDGRALEEIGAEFEAEGLCEFIIGLYFICDPQVGARRTLGFAAIPYDHLTDSQKHEVDELTQQISGRNQADRERQVHPIVEPKNAVRIQLPETAGAAEMGGRTMAVVDTSANVPRETMPRPVIDFIQRKLQN